MAKMFYVLRKLHQGHGDIFPYCILEAVVASGSLSISIALWEVKWISEIFFFPCDSPVIPELFAGRPALSLSRVSAAFVKKQFTERGGVYYYYY